MINLDADKLAETAQEAFNLAQNSRRWQTAITKAWGILRDSPFWHMAEGQALIILSPDSSELYEVTEGRCERVDGEARVACRAFAQRQPCKHRAARRLLVRYQGA
jgi:hypothetical protein